MNNEVITRLVKGAIDSLRAEGVDRAVVVAFTSEGAIASCLGDLDRLIGAIEIFKIELAQGIEANKIDGGIFKVN